MSTYPRPGPGHSVHLSEGGSPLLLSPVPLQDEAYKRKRLNKSINDDYEASSVAVDDDDDDDDQHEEIGVVPVKGLPTWMQLRRRVALSWKLLRLGTVFKILLITVLTFFLVRSIFFHVADREKSSHFTVVSILHDVGSETQATRDSWSFALQWSALRSWSEVVVGRNIIVFADDLKSCDFLQGQIRDLQCFVLPRDTCMHR